jgi:uncharacterized protein YfeS
MQFYVMARTYNIYGGHSTLSPISDFLLDGAEDFGPAVSELSVTFHFPHTGQARRTLEQTFAKFHANRQSLPKVVFRRTRAEVTIDIASELLDGKDWEQKRGLSLPLFCAAVAKTIAGLMLLRKRITEKDDFKREAFLSHCNDAQSRLPSSAEELAAIAEQWKNRKTARFATMSPWERLDIDWRDFHPEARSILDDPFYWECSNDFAPNGNDTGADLLADYRKWPRRHPSGDPIVFYRALVRRWGLPQPPASDIDRTVMDEAAVALAFAELKLRADCRPAVAALARAAIGRQRQEALDTMGWIHKEERLKTLDMLEAKLPGVSASGG